MEHNALYNFRDLLDEARDYHLMPERRPLLQSFRTRLRCCNYIMGHIFAVGGLTKAGEHLFKGWDLRFVAVTVKHWSAVFGM